MLGRNETHCLVKVGPVEDKVDNVYRQGYFEDVELKEVHRGNGYTKVYSYQFPAMLKVRSAAHVHAAARPLPAVQCAEHEAEFGHWSTWSGAPRVVAVELTPYERLMQERDRVLGEKSKAAASTNGLASSLAKRGRQ